MKLLKADLLKPTFHCTEDFIYLRKLVSGYDDLIKCGIRFKNQRSALFSAQGKEVGQSLDHEHENFVLAGLEQGISFYEKRRLDFELEFKRARQKFDMIKNLESIPGIGLIGAVTLAAIVVQPTRFEHRNHFLSYCGLVKHEVMSGGRSYGKRTPRYCRRLKCVFKTAALACLRGSENNILTKYYRDLMEIKKYPDYQARHALSRRIAALALGVMKTGEKFEAKRLKTNF